MEQNNKMQVFAYGEKVVRTLDREDGTWWVLKDVCRALNITDHKVVARRLDPDEVCQIPLINAMGRQQRTTIINEPGLYSAILRSDKPEAKNFKRWVTHEVLPSIRKTGSYGTGLDMKQVKEIIQETATALVGELVKQLVPVLAETVRNVMRETAAPQKDIHATDTLHIVEPAVIPRYKMETFPTPLLEQVDSIMERMMADQEINYSRIARFCVTNGYAISNPAVKSYYLRRFGGNNL